MKSLIVGIFLGLAASEANAKCLNTHDDYMKFATAVRSGSAHCSGYFIKKDLVLTARHCIIDSKDIRVKPVGKLDNKFFSAEIISSSSHDIVLLKTATPHPYLNDTDFQCVKTNGNIGSNVYKGYLLGADFSGVGFTSPLATSCKGPTQRGSRIICPTPSSYGQSGSVLLTLDNNVITVHGVLAEALGIEIGGVDYYNDSVINSVDLLNL